MRLISRRSPATMAASLSLSLVVLLAATVQAQNTDTATQAQATNQQTATQASTQATNTGATQTQTTAAGTTQASVSDLPNLSSTTDSSSTVSTASVSDAPSLTTSQSAFHLSGVPTIAGYGIPTQIVPWTGGAAYMQKSNLPDGTVFIVVGSILGFMALSVFLWRAMVAWSLHRSVRKAAMSAHRNDSMLKLQKPTTPYGGGMAGSTLSLDRLSAPTGKLSKHAPGHSVSSNNAGRSSSLFFSPTAGAGHHSSPTAALMSSNNRSSAYLPAGYYAAPGAAAPAQGAGIVPVGGSTPSPLSNLNPLHPSRAGYTRQTDYASSPPGSPGLPPSRPGTGRRSTEALGRGGRGYAGGYERSSGYGRPNPETGLYSQPSNSVLNLHVPGGNTHGGRAPSANLEDMFENHGMGPRER